MNWTNEQTIALDYNYNKLKKDVMEISTIMDIPTGKIISKLVADKKISKRFDARGYSSYKNSDEYASAVSANKAKEVGTGPVKTKRVSQEHQVLLNIEKKLDLIVRILTKDTE